MLAHKGSFSVLDRFEVVSPDVGGETSGGEADIFGGRWIVAPQYSCSFDPKQAIGFDEVSWLTVFHYPFPFLLVIGIYTV